MATAVTVDEADPSFVAAKERARAAVKASPPPPAPKPKPTTPAPAAAAEESEEGNEESTELLELDGEESTEGAEEATEKPDAEALEAMAKEGKLDEVWAALGGDPKAIKGGGPARLRAAQKREAKALAAEQSADKKVKWVKEQTLAGAQRFHQALELEDAAKKEDWQAFAQGLTKYLPQGMTLSKLVALMADGDGSVAETSKLAREVADLKAKLGTTAQTEAAAQTKQQEQTELAHLTKTLTKAKHPVANVPEFAALVRAELQKHYEKGVGYKITLRKAADTVAKRETERAKKVLGGKAPKVEPKVVRQSVRNSNGQYATPDAKSTPDDDLDAKFEAMKANVKRKIALSGRK